MANKYLDLRGLNEVASYVNQKLKVVSQMPANPNPDDMVAYNGNTTRDYVKGNVYIYTVVTTYYGWTNSSSGVSYYTKSDAPTQGDAVYSDNQGTYSGYLVDSYDDVNDQVTISSIVYDRDNSLDTSIYDWVSRSIGTSVILNGQDKTGNEADFYAPTAAGTTGQVLISNGENTAPSWASFTGYCPTIVNDSLYFTYGNIPEVENTSLIFEI